MLMLLSCCILMCLAHQCGGQKEQQTPTIWPESFSIKFLTNITTGSNDQTYSISNSLYYDWNLKSQAVVHGPGAFECAHFYNSTGGCTLLFTAKEMYRILVTPTEGQQSCCIDLPELGTVPPNWMISSNPLFLGTVTNPFDGVLVQEYAFPTSAGPMGMHSYMQIAKQPHTPASFTFPSDDGLQDYHFLVQSQVIGTQNASLFRVPAGCLGVLCKK